MSAVAVIRGSIHDAGSRVVARAARPLAEGPRAIGMVRTPALPRVVRIGLLGFGRIGQAVASVASSERDRLRAAGVEIECHAAFVRDVAKVRGVSAVQVCSSADRILDGGVDVIVEALGGLEPARMLVTRALDAGVPVVTANKTLVAHAGRALAELAARRGVAFTYEAAVLAGVPCLGALARRPLVGAARRIEAIINGTSHFLTTALAAGQPFDRVLADAIRLGYAEPDSSADVSGRDAAEKLTILLHLAGQHRVAVSDLSCHAISLLGPEDFADARRLGGTIKPVAIASLDPAAPGAWVGPALVEAGHPLASFNGVANALRIVGHSGRDALFAGPGAGPEATATTILDDIVELVTAQSLERRSVPAVPGSQLRLNEPAPSAWYLRLARSRSCDAPGLAQLLVARGVPALQIVADGSRLAARTTHATWAAIQHVVDTLKSRGDDPVVFPVVPA